MNCVGGKYYVAKEIVQAMLAAGVTLDRHIIEPFCGGLSVTHALGVAGFQRIECSDLNGSLIQLHNRALLADVEPFELDAAKYDALRAGPDCPEKALACLGCAFGGRWCAPMVKQRMSDRGGRYTGPQYTMGRSVRSVNRKIQPLRNKNVTFVHRSYHEIPPTENCVYYLDPPYQGTHPAWFKNTPFDPKHFREWVWERAAHNTMFVSEYSLEFGKLILEKQTPTYRASTKKGLSKKQTERLYLVTR